MSVVFLMGPTAVGKTELACQLFEQLPLRLISVDSALIYKGMDIGTGKPSLLEQARYPHALIDICDPWDTFSVGDFLQRATEAIEQALLQGQLPLLVGGTMMYFKALKEGLAALPPTDLSVRESLQQELQAHGLAPLYHQLQTVDPLTAVKLKPQDTQRILRALEVYKQTGKPMSTFLASAEKGVPGLPYPILPLALVPQSRAWLHQKIQTRVSTMLKAGLIEEVQGLLQKNPRPSQPLSALRSVGYRQVQAYLLGELDHKTLVQQILVATRQLAKRQITWIRSWPGVIELTVPSETLSIKTRALINQHLFGGTD